MYKISKTEFDKMPEELKALYVKLPNPSSEEVRECFPETNPSKKRIVKEYETLNKKNTVFETSGYKERLEGGIDDNGGNASRFFKSIIYQAKASKSERKLEDGTYSTHPTVKPIALMEYLIKMVTKKGGTVLDPFAGSGTTLVAAKKNGYNYIGIELTEEYIPIIEARLNATEYEEELQKEVSLF